METCKMCKSEFFENDVFCKVCKYPLQGTDKEKSAFVAKQIILEGDVKDAIERLDKSRWILFILGAFNIVAPFTPLVRESSTATTVISILLGLSLIGFGFLSFKKPKIALLLPLSIISFYYLLLLIISPMLFFKGLLWKTIILVGLGFGYFSVRKADRILKENEYLASKIKLK